MTKKGYVKISYHDEKNNGREEHIRDFEINFQFEIRPDHHDCIFRFPYDYFAEQSWFWVGYQTVPKHKDGDLVYLKLVNGNMVFHSSLKHETVQGGVIVKDVGSKDSYKIEFGFVN